jgi:hypothetical protein
MNSLESPKPVICPKCKEICKPFEISHCTRFVCPKCQEVYALLDGEPVPAKEH